MPKSRSRKPLRDDQVHIVRSMCTTCIFRSSNLMHLEDGRRDQMVRDAQKNDSAIICHSTLSGSQAVCFGFYINHATLPLRLAAALDRIAWDEPKELL